MKFSSPINYFALDPYTDGATDRMSVTFMRSTHKQADNPVIYILYSVSAWALDERVIVWFGNNSVVQNWLFIS